MATFTAVAEALPPFVFHVEVVVHGAHFITPVYLIFLCSFVSRNVFHFLYHCLLNYVIYGEVEVHDKRYTILCMLRPTSTYEKL